MNKQELIEALRNLEGEALYNDDALDILDKAISLVKQLDDPPPLLTISLTEPSAIKDFVNAIEQDSEDEMLEDMEKLVEALEFYADEQTYNLPHNVLLANFNGHMPISADRGAIAKQALNTYSEKYL